MSDSILIKLVPEQQILKEDTNAVYNNLKTEGKIMLIVSPNFSIKMLHEEINVIKSGKSDFTRSVDWRIAVPLGLLYLAGRLRNSGYKNIQIYDLQREFYLCRENGYFKENELSDFFEHFYDNVLKAGKIDILGISCLFNVASTTMVEMGKRCKRVSPHTKILLGGSYVTSKHHEVLQQGICDYVLLGEAEEEFAWLIDHFGDPLLSEKVYRNPSIVDVGCIDNPDKRSAIIEDLDALGLPAWDLLPHGEEYVQKSMHAERIGSAAGKILKSVPLLMSRGCYMKCTFCAQASVHGRKIRSHSVDYVLRQIDWLVKKYDVNHLMIEDDLFNYNPPRTIEFCKRLYEKYQDRFTIEFPNGLAIWNLNDEIMSHLKKIGLKNVTVAIESGNEYVQKHVIKKNLDLVKVKQQVEMIKRHGIGVRAFFIIGYVGETLPMMQDTIKYALELNIDWCEIKIFTPLVGSEMGDLAKEKGYIIGDTSEHTYRRAQVRTPDFTPEQVQSLLNDANARINFLNNKHLKEGNFEMAGGVFLNILKVYPNHLFAQWGLWKALEGQGKKEEAKIALERLIALSKRNKKNILLLEKYNIHLNYSKRH